MAFKVLFILLLFCLIISSSSFLILLRAILYISPSFYLLVNYAPGGGSGSVCVWGAASPSYGMEELGKVLFSLDRKTVWDSQKQTKTFRGFLHIYFYFLLLNTQKCVFTLIAFFKSFFCCSNGL